MQSAGGVSRTQAYVGQHSPSACFFVISVAAGHVGGVAHLTVAHGSIVVVLLPGQTSSPQPMGQPHSSIFAGRYLQSPGLAHGSGKHCGHLVGGIVVDGLVGEVLVFT